MLTVLKTLIYESVYNALRSNLHAIQLLFMTFYNLISNLSFWFFVQSSSLCFLMFDQVPYILAKICDLKKIHVTQIPYALLTAHAQNVSLPFLNLSGTHFPILFEFLGYISVFICSLNYNVLVWHFILDGARIHLSVENTPVSR